jgi:hypothetical protein
MPSLGIAPRPGGCAGRERMPMQDVAPVSDVFPADGYLHLLEIGVQAIKLSPYRTNRVAHRSIRLDTIAAFLACSCPSWAFRNEVSHSIQERPSESFPTVSGIRQSASRRNFAISRGSPGASLPTPGHDRRFPGMLFSPFHLSAQGSAIRSRDLSSRLCPLSGRYNTAPRGAATTRSDRIEHCSCVHRAPNRLSPTEPVHGRIRCRPILGGLINEYEPAA